MFTRRERAGPGRDAGVSGWWGTPREEGTSAMKMIVCVKQIPDPETPATAFKVDENAKKVIPAQGIAPVISPFDAQAVEAALRIRDAQGEGTITVLSMGPASARDVIK